MRTLSVLLCSLLVASVVLNLMLARKVKSLNETIELVKSEQTLNEGVIVPSITANAVDGSAAVISFDSVPVPTVLYVFTPPCGWCTRNLPAAKALAENVKGRYRVLGLSLSSEGLQKYLSDSGLSFPVYADISVSTRTAYHLGGTPDTIVVSSDGKVMKHWQGAYVGATKKEVESYFNVTLPSISDH
ncbi:MAG TPA: TlpA disulfide reductase family protein [Pyrinomonadaceae bacterium]|nr:TlpA disulfide reductase family protein [Pyrinomonadaceae bacterium]